MEHFIALDEQGRDRLGTSWCLPVKNGDGSWSRGEWMPPISGRILHVGMQDLSIGYSTLDENGLLGHLGASIYEVELRDDYWLRLVRAMNWDASVARSFACDCAEHVLPVVEILYPRTRTLHELLATCRAFLAGTASRDRLDAAVKRAKRTPVVRLDGWAYP